jgi:hypothetical protein
MSSSRKKSSSGRSVGSPTTVFYSAPSSPASAGHESYTYKSQRVQESGGSRKLHRAARITTDKGHEKNVALPEVEKILKSVSPLDMGISLTHPNASVDRYGVPTEWARWLGTPRNSGAFGVIFALKNEGEVAMRMKQMQKVASFQVQGKTIPDNAPFIIKIAHDYDDRGKVTNRNNVTRFAIDSVRENTWHRFLDNAACLRLPGAGSSTCPSQVVPDFLWSGMVKDAVSGRRF